jgi:hypothetical protein
MTAHGHRLGPGRRGPSPGWASNLLGPSWKRGIATGPRVCAPDFPQAAPEKTYDANGISGLLARQVSCAGTDTPVGCNESMAKFEEGWNCSKHSSEPSPGPSSLLEQVCVFILCSHSRSRGRFRACARATLPQFRQRVAQNPAVECVRVVWGRDTS